MAKVIKEDDHLEKEYEEKSHIGLGTVASLLFSFSVAVLCLYLRIKTGSYTPLIGFVFFAGVFLIVAVRSLFSAGERETEKDIIASGIIGEESTANLLATLPSDFTVIQDVYIEYGGKSSEIDDVVVGRTGVFVIESKNHNGHITGNIEDKNWIQHKVGRGGTPYSNEFYSPVKQVGTHIYRTAHFLRQNGIHTFVNGIVYFSNPETTLTISGEKDDIAIFSCKNHGRRDMLRYITKSENVLTPSEVKKIVKLICK